MGANSGATAAGAATKAAALVTVKAKVTAAVAVVPVTGNPKVEVGRNLPDTAIMQGTTQEFIPDRITIAD